MPTTPGTGLGAMIRMRRDGLSPSGGQGRRQLPQQQMLDDRPDRRRASGDNRGARPRRLLRAEAQPSLTAVQRSCRPVDASGSSPGPWADQLMCVRSCGPKLVALVRPPLNAREAKEPDHDALPAQPLVEVPVLQGRYGSPPTARGGTSARSPRGSYHDPPPVTPRRR